ncbi:MAG: hypothetical protein ACRDD7_16395 [Peptostreptococcaceae bacterium]
MNTTVEALNKYVTFLQKEHVKQVAKKRETERKLKEKNEELLKEYPDRVTVDEAFGMGLITEVKRDKLLTLLDGVNGGVSTSQDIYIKILNSSIKEAYKEIEMAERDANVLAAIKGK